MSWYEHCELKLSNEQLYLDEYVHIFCFITFFKVIFRKEFFQTFKEKLQKKVTKIRHVITPIQPDLPGLKFMKGTFHENGYCSQCCGLWLFVVIQQQSQTHTFTDTNLCRTNHPYDRLFKHNGLTLSTDLRFHDHVNQIIRKVNIALSWLSPLYTVASALPRPLLEQIYVTYVRPHFDYCDAIFDGHITAHDEHRLETLQYRTASVKTHQLKGLT